MSSYTSSLIIKLIDQASAPARIIGATLGRLQASQQRTSAALAASQGAMLGAAAAGFGLYQALSKPTQAAIAFEGALEDIAQKVDVPISQLQELGKEVRAVARATTLSAQEAASGIDVLAGMGASREDAMKLMDPIGKAATAYNAEVSDLAQAGYAALSNLKVPADQFAKALDAMAQAGKAGAFELKDMAQYFPTLGAAYQGLGQTGVPAVADLSAALQIVRKGTGDSASAATNLANIMQKMQAPQTVKAFRKMGVNLEKELKVAAKKGMTPIEAIAEITNRTLKGDMSKLGYLFADAQVQQGLRPLLQNIDEYRKIRKEAMEAQGVVEEDYQRRLKTGAAAAKRFGLAFESISITIGNILLPVLADLADKLVPIINSIADFAEANPELTRNIILATSAFVAFRVAATAARFALLWTKGGLLSAAISGMSGLGQATLGASKGFSLLRGGATIGSLFGTIFSGGIFASLISALGSVVGMIGGILASIGAAIAGVTAPVWGIIAAIVALVIGLALTVYNYWVPISRFIVGFASVIGEALGGIINSITGFVSAVASFATTKVFDFMEWLGIDPEKVISAIADVWNVVTDFTSGIIDWLKGLPEAIGNWFSDIFTMNEYSDSEAARFEEMGRNIAQRILNGLKNLPSTILSLIASIPSRLLSLAGAYFRLAMDWGGKLLQGFLYVLPMAINIWKSLPSRILSIAGNLMSVGLSLGLKMINGYWQGVTTIAGMLAGLPSLILSAVGDLASIGMQWGQTIATAYWNALTSLVGKMASLPPMLANAVLTNAAAFVEAGKQLMYALMDGIKQVMSEIVSYIQSSISNAASNAAGSLRGMLPEWMGGTPSPPATAAIDGARAAGGPVTRGGTYLVGEQGPELFSPGTSGLIHPASDTAAHLSSIANMRRPSLATALPSGGSASGSGSKQTSVNLGGVTINVQASPNMDVNALADTIMRKLSAEVDALGRSAFSDGVY
ncbi:phage tail tape measure protein [Bartonella sp. HY761]|uniref:phage tail tape measure protein n=1 Tax=Bartonella sp. HY761 TaxID=2979330 RepID=UPI002201882F|nr:phage tail tape measure protein [Bartonella sp. HY761]UXN05268.1 phage tail tape measure protein [Bartonella sp. HY761]